MNKLNNYFFGKNDKLALCETPYITSISMYELLDYDDKFGRFNSNNIELRNKINDNINFINRAGKVCIFYMDNVQINYVHGSDNFDTYIFNKWQYVDIFVYMNKEYDRDKIIHIPPVSYCQTAHRNGVKIYGSIVFKSVKNGGDFKLVSHFLQRAEDNHFPVADSLISLAKEYGFDGWYIEQQTEGGNTETAVFFQEFCKYVLNNSTVRIMWKNSMVFDGSIECQNEMTDKNISFYHSGEQVTNEFILDTNWTNDSLTKSVSYISSIYQHPNNLVAMVDASDRSIMDRCGMLRGYGNISIGISNIDLLGEDPNKFWSVFEYSYNIVRFPFATNFNNGKGQRYYMNGSVVSDKCWNDIGQQDILPICTVHNNIDMNAEYNDAYTGGSSLRVNGLIKAKSMVEFDLFKTEICMDYSNKIIHIISKRIVTFVKIMFVIYFKHGKSILLTLSDDVLYNVWTINKFKLLYDESIIDKISMRLENDDLGDKPFTFLIGGITIFVETDKPPEDPVNFKIDNIEQSVNAKESQKFYNRDKINLDVSWKYDEKIWYTYLFRCVVTDKNNRNEYLGRTSNNIFHIHNLKRHEDELYSMISIKSVGCNQLVNTNEALVRV